jgi:hypothetical protein
VFFFSQEVRKQVKLLLNDLIRAEATNNKRQKHRVKTENTEEKVIDRNTEKESLAAEQEINFKNNCKLFQFTYH